MHDPLRKQLKHLLKGRGAHLPFEEVVRDLPESLRGKQADGLPHTAWELVEHMRIAQADILRYCRKANYVAPEWPDDYWPDSEAPPSSDAWHESIDAFALDLKALVSMATDPEIDLHGTVPSSDKHTVLRELLIVADHNAYHAGQLVYLRRLLGSWPPADS